MYCSQCGSCIGSIPENQNYIRCSSCGHTVYRNPTPCVSVLIVRDSQILLVKRGNTSIMPGKWCLPCGHIEEEENFVDAACRETKEETNIDILPLSIVNAVTNHFSGDIHSLVVVLVAEPITNLLHPGDDAVDAAWFPIDGPLPEMAFQADMHIIDQYRRYGHSIGIPLNRTKIEFFE